MPENEDQKPHGNLGGHPRAYIASKPNGGYVMKGRGKPSYTFYLVFFALFWTAVIFAAMT